MKKENKIWTKKFIQKVIFILFVFGFLLMVSTTYGAYDAPYGTGNRTTDITVTSSGFTWTNNVGTCTTAYESCFVNGNTTTDQIYAPTNNGESVTGKYIRFQFPEQIIIQEISIGYSGTHPSGTWKTQGSNDASTWTDVGSTFTFGGASVDVVDLSTNTTAYSYYQVIGVSGTYSYDNYTREAEFSWVYEIPPEVFATSTIDQTQQNMFFMFLAFCIGLIFVIIIFK